MRIETYDVEPALPEKLKGLREIAYNLLWTWNEATRSVFIRMDRELWERTYQNPVLMLGSMSQERLEELAGDQGFMAFYERIYRRFREYLEGSTWWDKRYSEKPLIAYFCAEFGLAECLPIYSGGLGVLAGHHLKSASDLGVPLVGVGLLYQQGYFRQYLTSDGWQQERNPKNDFSNQPVEPAQGPDGEPLIIELDVGGELALVRVWKAAVGRVPLVLLDTSHPENSPGIRDITNQLYGGDQEHRIRQEIVLGMGGLKALQALDQEPVVCHMNEGHSAFLALERIRDLVQRHGVRFDEALQAVRAGGVFTTHTPVPAGFDVFPADLIKKYFSRYLEELRLPLRALMSLGRGATEGQDLSFNMAGLALRTSAFANGVSKLHGEISRSLLHSYLPNVPQDEVPVGHVTNGAHTPSCVSGEMAGLFDRYLGPGWWERPGQPDTWKGVDDIPAEELWSTHERRRTRLVTFARQRLVRQLQSRGGSQKDVERAKGVLIAGALTIGFARRFATYKRADLILRDLERLKAILLDEERPVQLLFAGKAHPHDNPGKEMMKAIVQFCQQEEVRHRAVFLEDYDLVVARYLVQGVDVWLNTPRRPHEASGTSGMKVLPNGGLNLSVPDGWWNEAYHPDLGWAIGRGEEYEDHEYQNRVESNALYDILEKDVVPLFYERGADGLPRGWIEKMKLSMKLLTPLYSTNRMIWEYSERFYIPSARYFKDLTADSLARARVLAKWQKRIHRHWDEVRVEAVTGDGDEARRVGESLKVTADVRLGTVEPSEVCVEVYYGLVSAHGEIEHPRVLALALEHGTETGLYRFRGSLECDRSGKHGFAVRVRPNHPDANNILSTGLMTWR